MASQLDQLRVRVEQAIVAGAARLVREQHPEEGCFDLGFDGGALPDAHFILMDHFLGLGATEVTAALVRRLLDRQLAEGGWAPAPGLAADVALSAEAYVALRSAGLGYCERALQRARQFIAAQRGAAPWRGPTRFTLALVGLHPWADTTVPPPELALLPPEAPVSLFRVSAPLRLHLVPLLVLRAAEVVTAPDLGQAIGQELGLPWVAPQRPPQRPRLIRNRAITACLDFMTDRLDPDGTLGGLLLATGWAALAAQAMGLPGDHPLVSRLPRGLLSLIHDVHGRNVHVQVCRPTVRTTALAVGGLRQTGVTGAPLDQAVDYLLAQQAGAEGDFSRLGPAGPARGWSIKPQSRCYPSLLDTIEVVDALTGLGDCAHVLNEALQWVLSMQRPDGGFALFDRAAATAPWLRHLASALLTHTLSDESSPEVTGRLLSATATRPLLADVRDRAVGFLGRSQGSDGAWTSPFSVGCLPATSSALAGLGAVGQGFRSPARRALAFLLERQGSDGGWGESPRSLGQNYVDLGRSLPSLTGRAVNALLSLRDPAARDAVERGVWYLVRTQEPDGSWQEDDPTAACLSEVLYVRNPVESLVRPLVALQAFLATDQVSSRLGGIARPVESSPDRLGQ